MPHSRNLPDVPLNALQSENKFSKIASQISTPTTYSPPSGLLVNELHARDLSNLLYYYQQNFCNNEQKSFSSQTMGSAGDAAFHAFNQTSRTNGKHLLSDELLPALHSSPARVQRTLDSDVRPRSQSMLSETAIGEEHHNLEPLPESRLEFCGTATSSSSSSNNNLAADSNRTSVPKATRMLSNSVKLCDPGAAVKYGRHECAVADEPTGHFADDNDAALEPNLISTLAGNAHNQSSKTLAGMMVSTTTMPPANLVDKNDADCVVNELLMHNNDNQHADAAAAFLGVSAVDSGHSTTTTADFVNGFVVATPESTSAAAAATAAVNDKLREIQLSLTHLSTDGGGTANKSEYAKQRVSKKLLDAAAVTQMPPNFSQNSDQLSFMQKNPNQTLPTTDMPFSSLANDNHVLMPTQTKSGMQVQQKSPDLNYFDPLSTAGVPTTATTTPSPSKVMKKSFSADNLQQTAAASAGEQTALKFMPALYNGNGNALVADHGFLPTAANGYYAVDHNGMPAMLGSVHHHQQQQHCNYYPPAFSTASHNNLPQQYYVSESSGNGSAIPNQCAVTNGRLVYQHNISNNAVPPRMHASGSVPFSNGFGMSSSRSGIFVPRTQMPFPGFVTLTAPPTRVTAQPQLSSSTVAVASNHQSAGTPVDWQPHNGYSAQMTNLPANLTSSWRPSPLYHQPPVPFPTSTAYPSHHNVQQSKHTYQPAFDAHYRHHPGNATPATNGQIGGYGNIQSQQYVGHGPQPSAVRQHHGQVNQLVALSSPPTASTFGSAIALFTQQQQQQQMQTSSPAGPSSSAAAVSNKKVDQHRRRRRRKQILKLNSSTYAAVSGGAADTPTGSSKDEVGYIPNGNSASGSDSANEDDNDDDGDDDEDDNNTVEDTPEPEDDVEYESRKLIQEAAAMGATHASYADTNSAFSAGGSARYVHQRPPHPHAGQYAMSSSSSFLGGQNDDHSALRRQTSISSSKSSSSSAVMMQNGSSTNAETTAAAAAAAATAATANNLRDGAAVVTHAAYLGSTHLFCESRVSRATRLAQCQEALTRIKAPDGESQPMIDVDICISIEKVVIVNTDTSHVLMEHALRTISYTADMGDLVVLMVKRGLDDLPQALQPGTATQPKMLCHVFQSQTAPAIAQCVGQAFQVAYVEFLKANGVQDERYLRMLDYQEVLASQEMASDELDAFATKERQKDVIIPKQKQEPLGIAIVESGWGSLVPTVVVANIQPGGAAGRTGKLNIGDQILNVDGVSCVGLPLKRCQQLLKDTRATKLAVKLSVVPTSPVVSVRIRRPDTRYQLGFSVQNGIICSLLRGGIAERGGIRVGHRIIEINGQSVVSTSHEQIVSMLAHSIGDILIKTMPTSIYRLLTGQEQPMYI